MIIFAQICQAVPDWLSAVEWNNLWWQQIRDGSTGNFVQTWKPSLEGHNFIKTTISLIIVVEQLVAWWVSHFFNNLFWTASNRSLGIIQCGTCLMHGWHFCKKNAIVGFWMWYPGRCVISYGYASYIWWCFLLFYNGVGGKRGKLPLHAFFLSSPPPFLTTSLPHHSPSSSLPFFANSLREFEDLKLVSSADPLSVFDAKQLGVFSHFGTFC